MESYPITNAEGESLSGILHPADNKDLAIVCHGRLCTKEMHFLPDLSESLRKKGLNTYRFDFSGCGESDGVFEESTVTKEIEDLESVVSAFRGRGYTARVIVGHSMGALVVLQSQAKYGSAERVISISGTVNQEEVTVKKLPEAHRQELDSRGYLDLRSEDRFYRMSRDYLYDRLSYGDIRATVSRITVPIHIIHGRADSVVPFENGIMLAEVLRKDGTLDLIEGADHFYSIVGRPSPGRCWTGARPELSRVAVSAARVEARGVQLCFVQQRPFVTQAVCAEPGHSDADTRLTRARSGRRLWLLVPDGEYLLKRINNGREVGIGLHQVCHYLPPILYQC